MDKLDYIREKALKDYFFLCKHVLNYDKMRPYPHQVLCDHVSKTDKDYSLTLMPRGSYKSSVVTVGKTVDDLVHNPDLRILIASETQRNAIKYVKEIKTHFESNEKFISVFGNYVSRSLWRDDQLIVRPRRAIKKEPSVQAGSLEKNILVGMHFDRIILDDVVSPATVNTPAQIQKTLDYFRYLISILDPGGKIHVIGTRYSTFDLYGTILDPSEGLLEDFNILIMKAMDDYGEPNMPDILSKEFLEKTKKKQGSYIFNAQYQNVCISDETATFRQKDENVYRDGDEPKGLLYFMTVDPAVSRGEKSDFSGIIVNGVDHEHKWWVKEALQLKLDPDALIAKILELASQYNIMTLGMQQFALETFLKLALEREMEKRRVWIPIKSLVTDTRVSKEARIKSLQPRWENGDIRIRSDQKELLFQFINFPQLKNDDLIDAMQMQTQITFPADLPKVDEITQKYDKLPEREGRIWRAADKAIRRSVRRKKAWERNF